MSLPEIKIPWRKATKENFVNGQTMSVIGSRDEWRFLSAENGVATLKAYSPATYDDPLAYSKEVQFRSHLLAPLGALRVRDHSVVKQACKPIYEALK